MVRKRFNQFRPAKKASAPSAINQIIEIDIVGLAHDGRGVGRRDSKVVFVKGALPGERVQARVGVSKKHYDEGHAESLVTESAQRREPFCPVYQQCGGCQLQHMSDIAQLGFKEGRLRDVIGPLDSAGFAESSPILTAAGKGYRHRARLSYRAGHLGFKAASSHQIVDIDHCPVLMPPLNSALADRREQLMDYLGRVGSAELLLAQGEGDRVALRIQQQKDINTERCRQLADALRGTMELHSVVAGDNQWRGDIAALQYPGSDAQPLYFSPADFTQANPEINALMVDQVCQWLAVQPGETVADFFCGLGNFSLALAAAGARVLGFDLGEDMILAAQRQADTRALNIVYGICDLFTTERLPLPKGTTKVLLDPPRAGARRLCELLASRREVRDIVYVSCDTGSLSRDLQILCSAGFQPKAFRAADMFPHSYHLESMVWLSR